MINIFLSVKQYFEKYLWAIAFGILSLCLFIGMCFAIKGCSDANKRSNNNIIALTDTIKYYKSKTGNLVASKTLLEGNLSTLKLVNDSLYNVLKDIRIIDPVAAVNFSGIINNGKNDTIWAIKQDSLHPQSAKVNIKKDFSFNNKYRKLEGYVTYDDSILGLKIEQDNVYFDYTVAVQNNTVYISSDNPYVTYKKIAGITLTENKKKKWSVGVGPQIGYGYDFVAKKTNPYIGVGVSIQYNLLQW